MKMITILTVAALSLALAGPAAATQLFDFNAQAILPIDVGGSAEVYGVIVNGDAVDTPLPLDFGSYEYTLVITGLTLDAAGSTDYYSGGFIAIYEDAGTAADYADPSSFADGTAILSGVITEFQHTTLLGSLGNGQGYVDWTGGSRLGDLAAEDQTGWPLLTSTNTSATYVEPGYTALWDGKVEPSQEVVSSEDISLSGIKALFR